MGDDFERCCRICFASENEPTNPLFRPCHCRGSMRWVHMECLEHWRSTSVNPNSFYECEQCKFKYRFGASSANKFFLARLLASSFAVHLLSFALLLCLIFVGGFVGKSFDSSLDWIDVFRCFNLNHILAGCATTGIGSLLGWATSMGGIGGGGGWRMIIGDGWNGVVADRGGGGRDVVSMVLMTIMILAGLAVAFYWIYERLEEVARKTTRMAQSVVLDVQGGPDVSATGDPPGVGADDGASETPIRRSTRLAEQQQQQQQQQQQGGLGVARPAVGRRAQFEPVD